MIWYILGIISIVLLITYGSKGSNAVWGGLTLGIIIGLIVAIFFVFMGTGFHWQTIIKVAIIGTLLGSITELWGIVGTKLFKK